MTFTTLSPFWLDGLLPAFKTANSNRQKAQGAAPVAGFVDGSSVRQSMQTPNLETRLTHLFSLMEARKTAIRREREDAKLSRRRYWWQEPQTKQTQTPCHENP